MEDNTFQKRGGLKFGENECVNDDHEVNALFNYLKHLKNFDGNFDESIDKNSGTNFDTSFENKTIINKNKNKCIVTMGLLNIHSIISKYNKIYELIHEGLDILVLVETWHRSHDDFSVQWAMPPGFTFVDAVRKNDPYHGGIIIYLRSVFRFKQVNLPALVNFEAIALRLFFNNNDCIMLAVYRPGSAQITSSFFAELTLVLENLSLLSSNIILAGDFNVRIDRIHDPHAICLVNIFDCYNLVNRIDKPTHCLSGILDLIYHSIGEN